MKGLFLKGNGNLLETVRPITSFKEIIFDGEGNYKIKTKTQLHVKLKFVQENSDLEEELKIQADQNLQKYFMVESNGEYLRIKLDYLKNQDDTHPLIKANEYVLNSTQIQIEITTKKSNVVVINKNFQPFDLSVNRTDSCQTSKYDTERISFNCRMVSISSQYEARLGCYRIDFDHKNCTIA